MFKTESVTSEFIVKFAGFYVEAARRKYVDVALKTYDSDQYEILPRNNPMAAYPSDFDVVVSLVKAFIFLSHRCRMESQWSVLIIENA